MFSFESTNLVSILSLWYFRFALFSFTFAFLCIVKPDLCERNGIKVVQVFKSTFAFERFTLDSLVIVLDFVSCAMELSVL